MIKHRLQRKINTGNPMMKRILILLLATFILSSTAAIAESGGIVEAIQMPAWYDRDGVSRPLKPGIDLFSGDVIHTGKNARALLRMSEGSIIKLGEDAKLNINTLTPPEQEEGVFAALLRVTRGAFRFTTTAIGKTLKRNVDIKIGHVTVGIRGTDIWGRSQSGEDLFCLIEGKVNVEREGETEFMMQDPLTYIVAPQDQPTTAVTPVDMNELGKWARETETRQGQGILTTNGEWAVNMMSLQNSTAADNLQQQLHAAGFAAVIQQVQVNGQAWLRVRIEGFVSRQDASSFASAINNQYGIQHPWVVKF
jgi:hypothetical protein